LTISEIIKGYITADTNEIQSGIREYLENLCPNKLENLQEMDKLLDACDLSKLN
jgi:hypothetical protein